MTTIKAICKSATEPKYFIVFKDQDQVEYVSDKLALQIVQLLTHSSYIVRVDDHVYIVEGHE